MAAVISRGAFEWPRQGVPEIRVAVRVPFSPSGADRAYRHPTYAIHQHFYRGCVRIGRRTFQLQPGDVTITPPDVVSRYALETAGHHWCIHFRAAPGGPNRIRLPLHLPSRGAAVTDRFRAIARALDSLPRQRPVARAAGGALLLELLLHLALEETTPRRAVRVRRKSDAALDSAREHLDQHFSRNISVEELARSSGLSRNYFSARFRARFGLTVDAYLLRRRIECARLLLVSTELPVKEVAFECGIPDPHYFNKQFRRAAGMSPSGYRTRHVKKW